MATRAYGLAPDHLRVTETLHLNGEGARGLTKTRIAVRDQAVSEVRTTAEGNAPFTGATWTARESCAVRPSR